jgi:hypothetical protein
VSYIPVGKLRSVTETGIATSEWRVNGAGGDNVLSYGSWNELSNSVFLTFSVDTFGGVGIVVNGGDTTTRVCGSVKITTAGASAGGGYYY